MELKLQCEGEATEVWVIFCVWEYRFEGDASTMGIPKGNETNVRAVQGDKWGC